MEPHGNSASTSITGTSGGTPGSSDAVAGCRLDLPAGEALLLRPGEQREAVVVVVTGSS